MPNPLLTAASRVDPGALAQGAPAGTPPTTPAPSFVPLELTAHPAPGSELARLRARNAQLETDARGAQEDADAARRALLPWKIGAATAAAVALVALAAWRSERTRR